METARSAALAAASPATRQVASKTSNGHPGARETFAELCEVEPHRTASITAFFAYMSNNDVPALTLFCHLQASSAKSAFFQ